MHVYSIREKTRSVLEETLRLNNILISIATGALANVAQGKGLFEAPAPHIVAFAVLVLARATASLKIRRLKLLSELVEQRDDPAFAMDLEGNIEITACRNTIFFQKKKIKTLFELFDDAESIDILKSATKDSETGTSEYFSPTVGKWYRIQTKHLAHSNRILLWLQDTTESKMLELSLSVIRNFSSEIIDSIDLLIKNNDSYDRLCRLIFQEGFEGVFIARKNENGKLQGHVCKSIHGRLCLSDNIRIDQSSKAPVWKSRRAKRIVAISKAANESREEFEKKHPFDPRVKAFLDQPITNYVNYHEGDVSIIAFNKRGGIATPDISVMETLVNTARSVAKLIDLAMENDEKFLQIITGLCAAAEYSDDLTGEHILRVNRYAKLTALHMNKNAEFVERIGKVAALHDIGKVAIPEIIKLKRKLKAEEIDKMRMHTIYGAQILDRMIALSDRLDPRLEMAKAIVLHHHQCWDGSGYPGLVDIEETMIAPESKDYRDYENLRPLRKEEIPVEALIVSLADKYDALRSPRSYKPAFSHEKTCELLEMDDRKGSLGENVFGIELFEVFMEIRDEFNAVYEDIRKGDTRTL